MARLSFSQLRRWCLALAALQISAAAAAENAACTCTGLDYTNGGSYLVDGTSEADFTFTSVFQCMSPCLPSDQHGEKLHSDQLMLLQHVARIWSSPSCSIPRAWATSARPSTWTPRASSSNLLGNFSRTSPSQNGKIADGDVLARLVTPKCTRGGGQLSSKRTTPTSRSSANSSSPSRHPRKQPSPPPRPLSSASHAPRQP